MTMHIHFNQDKDGYKNGWSGYVERTLARRFCDNGIAIPYQKHLDNVYDREQAKKEAAAEKKAELLKEKESAAMTTKADSKKQKKSERAVKK